MNPSQLTAIKRPSPHARNLSEHLVPYCDVKDYIKNKKLSLLFQGEPVCYLVLSGYVSVYRIEDQLLLANFTSPAIIGLSNNGQDKVKIVTITKCTLARISKTAAMKIIDEKNLWKSLAYFYMDFSEKVYLSFDLNTHSNSYEKIKSQLYELMAETKEYRNSVSVEQYIRDKTLLSRSGVMRILSALKNGGYIEIERGILININNLPDKY